MFIFDAAKGDLMKKRHYTLQQMGDSLCLTIKGKFLNTDFGLEAGDYLQLTQQNGQLILLKQPKLVPEPSPALIPNPAPDNRFSWEKNGRIIYNTAKI